MPDPTLTRIRELRADLEAILDDARDLNRWADSIEADVAAGRPPDTIDGAIFGAYVGDLGYRYELAEAAAATLAAEHPEARR
jgi:hypothetical protein